jgi:transcriptional regulator with XRE-family HTH domain
MKEASSIGKLIQTIRISQGLTQEQLANKAQISYATLIKVEAGATKNPSARFVWKIAQALNTSFESLLAPRTFHGPHSVRQIWEDMLQTLRAPGEYMYISGVSEKQFLSSEKEAFRSFIRQLKVRGFKQKILSQKGDKHFLKEEHIEYRVLPRKHFNPTPMYVYGDKLAVLVWGPPQQVIIIEQPLIADAYRKQFLFIWERAERMRQ